MTIAAARAPEPTLDVRALTKIAGAVTALQDVTFSATAGEIVSVSGAAGAGKTVLLKLIAGHIAPSGGRIRIHGLDPRTSRLAATSRIGYVPQVRPACGSMKPGDLLDVCGRARPIPPALLNRRLRDVVELCELGDHLQRACGHLDESVRVRVSLAQALLHEPTLLLLDNCFEELPDEESRRLATIVEQLRARTTILVGGTHSAGLDVTQRLELLEGRLVTSRQPARPAVALI